jgi:4-hydroxy-2-oxoheptanedioate aldolase
VHNGVPEVARRRAAMGFDLVTLSSDARILMSTSQQLLAAMK